MLHFSDDVKSTRLCVYVFNTFLSALGRVCIELLFISNMSDKRLGMVEE